MLMCCKLLGGRDVVLPSVGGEGGSAFKVWKCGSVVLPSSHTSFVTRAAQAHAPIDELAPVLEISSYSPTLG